MAPIFFVFVVVLIISKYGSSHLKPQCTKINIRSHLQKSAACILLTSQFFLIPANAELDDINTVSNAGTNQVISSTSVKSSATEEERVKRKLELQRQSKSVGTSESNSYLDSLSRERSKQEGQKKTKSARSKDLCEVLGRGC